MARWATLLDTCGAAAARSGGLPAGPQMLRLLCLRSAEAGAGSAAVTRHRLLEFYEALDQRQPVLTDVARRGLADPAWRAAWAEAEPPDGGAAGAAAAAAAERLLAASRGGVAVDDGDLETVLRAAMVAAVPPGPPLHSEFKQSYRGAEPVRARL